jgi:hypothetical protein
MPERARKSGNGRGSGGLILVSPLHDAVDDSYRRLWHERAVPELLWVAELLRGRRLRDSFRLAIAVASTARSAAPPAPFTLFAAAGSYAVLEGERIAAFRQGLAARDALLPFETGLAELHAVFPAYPLAPLAAAEQAAPIEAGAAGRRLLERIEALDDPCSRIALRVQLVVLWQAVQAGVLRGGSTARVAELAHASRFPLTAESVPAARELLALAAQLLQIEQLLPATSWPERFWRLARDLASATGRV